MTSATAAKSAENYSILLRSLGRPSGGYRSLVEPHRPARLALVALMEARPSPFQTTCASTLFNGSAPLQKTDAPLNGRTMGAGKHIPEHPTPAPINSQCTRRGNPTLPKLDCRIQ